MTKPVDLVMLRHALEVTPATEWAERYNEMVGKVIDELSDRRLRAGPYPIDLEDVGIFDPLGLIPCPQCGGELVGGLGLTGKLLIAECVGECQLGFQIPTKKSDAYDIVARHLAKGINTRDEKE